MRPVLLFLVATAFSLGAAAKPSPESARKVIDFYFNGQNEGIVLADVRLCEAVHSEGKLKHECKGELKPDGLEAGKPFMVWMMFMVPSGIGPQEVTMRFSHEGQTTDVKTATVTSSVRYRVWRQVNLDRSGRWSVTITHDVGPDIEPLREIALEVRSPTAP